jgi:hypothetical protein
MKFHVDAGSLGKLILQRVQEILKNIISHLCLSATGFSTRSIPPGEPGENPTLPHSTRIHWQVVLSNVRTLWKAYAADRRNEKVSGKIDVESPGRYHPRTTEAGIDECITFGTRKTISGY